MENNLNKIVAYDASGLPLTLEEFKAKIERGIEDFKNGRYMSAEELAIDMQSW